MFLYTKTIKKNIDFKRMYYRSKFKIGFLTVIYYKKNKNKETKLGITVSKKVGNAVKRNRVRRIILAAYKELEKQENLKGSTFVIVARKNCFKVKMWDVFKELKKNIFFVRKKETKRISISWKNLCDNFVLKVGCFWKIL